MKGELLVLHGYDALRDADATRLRTIDGHGSGIVEVERVEQTLYHHTLKPHKEGAAGEHVDGCRKARKEDYALVRSG